MASRKRTYKHKPGRYRAFIAAQVGHRLLDQVAQKWHCQRAKVYARLAQLMKKTDEGVHFSIMGSSERNYAVKILKRLLR